jgi:glutathione synthase/RimK-type ligase-like ATP-grasp enzyme
MTITFLRRKGLGGGSIKGMVGHLTGIEPETVSVLTYVNDKANVLRNDKVDGPNFQAIKDKTEWLVRWGCTTGFGFKNSHTINVSEAIKEVSNKMGFRKKVSDNAPELAPRTVYSLIEASQDDINYPLVLRPMHHSQGKNLWLVHDHEDLVELVNTNKCLQGGWYASEYINKVAEYRVYVVSGRVATVAKKTPDDPKAVAWNVAQGGRFDVVRWGDWDFNVLDVALRSFELTSLDFGGVDIMVDGDGRAYLIEINSAPSLPIMVAGQVSYRQQCMAKCFEYISENGKDKIKAIGGGWRGYVHPAVYDKAVLE